MVVIVVVVYYCYFVSFFIVDPVLLLLYLFKMSGVKRVTLTIQQRMDVLRDLETTSIQQVAATYNVHAKTIRRIKDNAVGISRLAENKDQRKRRRIKEPLYPELEQQLNAWFIERRTLGDRLIDALLL